MSGVFIHGTRRPARNSLAAEPRGLDAAERVLPGDQIVPFCAAPFDGAVVNAAERAAEVDLGLVGVETAVCVFNNCFAVIILAEVVRMVAVVPDKTHPDADIDAVVESRRPADLFTSMF